MEITLVRALRVGEPDRAYFEIDGVMERVAVHVVHDLPHLVVESMFDITDGLWSELAAGRHAAANRAASARHAKRQKLGRIVSGAAAGIATNEWLTDGHRQAKTLTNCVVNRWGDGPDTPAGVRARAAQADASVGLMLDAVDDGAIAVAIQGVKVLQRVWVATPPGGSLRLAWPLSRVRLAALVDRAEPPV